MDVASRGAFKRQSAEEATQLIEEVAKRNYRAPFEALRYSSKLRTRGVIELNKMSAIEAKLDSLMIRMNTQEKRGHSYNEVGTVEGAEQRSIDKKGLAHEGPYQREEAQYINGYRSYNFRLNNNLPTHYTPALRNHENLSYGGGMQHGLRLVQNYQNYHNHAPHGFQG